MIGELCNTYLCRLLHRCRIIQNFAVISNYLSFKFQLNSLNK